MKKILMAVVTSCIVSFSLFAFGGTPKSLDKYASNKVDLKKIVGQDITFDDFIVAKDGNYIFLTSGYAGNIFVLKTDAMFNKIWLKEIMAKPFPYSFLIELNNGSLLIAIEERIVNTDNDSKPRFVILSSDAKKIYVDETIEGYNRSFNDKPVKTQDGGFILSVGKLIKFNKEGKREWIFEREPSKGWFENLIEVSDGYVFYHLWKEKYQEDESLEITKFEFVKITKVGKEIGSYQFQSKIDQYEEGFVKTEDGFIGFGHFGLDPLSLKSSMVVFDKNGNELKREIFSIFNGFLEGCFKIKDAYVIFGKYYSDNYKKTSLSVMKIGNNGNLISRELYSGDVQGIRIAEVKQGYIVLIRLRDYNIVLIKFDHNGKIVSK